MNLRRTLSSIVAPATVVLASLIGCARVATLDKSSGDLPQLPLAKMADEMVVLEVAMVPVPQSETWDLSVWSEIDEQHLPPELRQRMASNGFRAGVVGLQLPEGLREQLDARQHSGARGVLADLTPGEEHAMGARRIQLRDGNRSDVVTRSSQPSMVVLVDDGNDLVGKTFKDAQPTFTLRAFRLADGRARIELTPEVRFGPTRQRWASGEGVFRMESGQDRRSFDALTIETVLSAGQTLVVAASGPARSLGGNFFAKRVEGQREKAMLIRLSETGYGDFYDDLTTELSTVSPVVQVTADAKLEDSSVDEAWDEPDVNGMSLTTELD